ncbi:hypothetical protein niasHS_008130 [Heterodera schachtii]|uniref:C2H2-type domain-containing protein n=1 Tax=Heterodera schachtii TaxID=97005 RepID=A0ABD2J741_HETSC
MLQQFITQHQQPQQQATFEAAVYRCLACPRDFFYVTDTTAKNHIPSFHSNDLSLLENNYHTYAGLLHGSRREFFGTVLRGGSEARTTRKKRAAAAARGALAAAATLKRRGGASGLPKQARNNNNFIII